MQQGVDVVIGGHPHTFQPYGTMSDKEGHSMLIFYSLGNFVSTQESFDALLEGMGCFTIQKTVKDGQTSIEIIDPQIKPMVMHYNKDAGVFSPYMLSITPKNLLHSMNYEQSLEMTPLHSPTFRTVLKKSCP